MPWRHYKSGTDDGLNSADICIVITKGIPLCRALPSEFIRFDRPLTLLGAIACHIRAQNCGLVATYDDSDHTVILEAFEVSAQNDQVLASSSGLMRCFPGVSVAVPATRLAEPTFRSYLANNISQLASEDVSRMIPKTKKAGTKVDEIRDMAHPGLITEGLMVQLLAFGNSRSDHDRPITKSVRDEVNWNNALLPWRRSPAWLVLRVALQLVLRRSFQPAEHSVQYKNFLLYLMAKLGCKAPAYMLPHVVDGLSIIWTKLGRRMYKMQGSVFAFVSQLVHEATNTISRHLRDLQQAVIGEDRRMVCQLPPAASPEHCRLSLLNCKNVIYDLMHYSVEPQQDFVFNQKSPPPFTINQFGLPNLEQDTIIALNSFEKWVEEELPSWLQDTEVSQMGDACHQVKRVIERYFTLAAPKYELDAQAKSLMVLTVLELWVTLDKMGVTICPLLKSFSPEIPAEFLEPLLLPKWSEMQRAERIFDYIRRRRDAAAPAAPSIFSDPSPGGFAVQYYDQSPEHQKLRRSIEQHGHRCRNSKQQELARLTATWSRLRDDPANVADHSYMSDGRHASSCKKCSLEQQMNRISIQVHEWPLPEEEFACKAVVFELMLPQWFGSWRDATWKICHDICGRTTLRAGDLEVRMLDYSGTAQFQKSHGQRLTLGSFTKSWTVSHYSGVHLPVTESRVCLRNALRFRLLDSTEQGWVQDQHEPTSIKKHCTLQIPDGPYSNMQYALNSFRHTQNEVLADQSKCDRKLSLHEFVAYGCLRAGEQVQWYNMLRELASTALSFNEQPVVQLYKQAAWELGSFCHKTQKRVSHQVFQDPKFCERLLEVSQNRLDMIEGNWKEHRTLHLLVTLGVRAITLLDGYLRFSVAESRKTLLDALTTFLRNCREVALGWCERLSFDLHDCSEEQSQSYQDLILKIAATCQGTYDVDPEHTGVVLHSSRDLSCLTRSSILLFENSPSEIDKLPPSDLRIALQSAQRVRCLLKDQVSSMVSKDPTGLNEAVRKIVWYLNASSTWRQHNTTDGWLSTQTEGTGQIRQQQVHYDILTGELLVDGTPPGRLPKEFTTNALYRKLFGCKALPVTPSNLPGMTFVTARKCGEFEVHFGMSRDSQVFVRARSPTKMLQLVPPEALAGDLPYQLIADYFHWVDMETGVIEFRASGRPWKIDPHDWHARPDERNIMTVEKGENALIDVRSSLFLKIADILQPLDTIEHMIVVKTAMGVIEVELTRLRLKFFVNKDGSLSSRDLDASVDTNQDIGCLYGLANKLVVRGNTYPHSRSVIIPYGRPVTERNGCHVRITLTRTTEGRIKYLRYVLDEQLQLLNGPPHLLASLYLAYLHAVTSFPLPDHSTHRTGTQEALRILGQGRLQSPFSLASDCLETLQWIADLTPARMFYPRHLKVMQKTNRNGSLSQLAQHNAFRAICQRIFKFSQMFATFHDCDARASSDNKVLLTPGNELLFHRASYLHGQLCEIDGDFSPEKSVWYVSRDSDINSPRSNRVYEVAALIRDWPSTLAHEPNLVSVMRSLKSVTTNTFKMPGMSCSSIMDLTLGQAWTSLYAFCRSIKREEDSYTVMVILSTIAFSGEIDQSCIRHFLLMAFSGSCFGLSLPAPCSENLHPQQGEKCVHGELRQAIDSAYLQWISPAHTWGLSNRERSQREKEARNQWQAQKTRDIQFCCQEVASQWPCLSPDFPSRVPRVNGNVASQKCQDLFAVWFRNKEFFDFLRRVQETLAPLQADIQGTERRPIVRPTLTLLDSNATHYKFQPTGLFELICKSSPIEGGPRVQRHEPPRIAARGVLDGVEVTTELWSLAETFRKSSIVHHREYGKWLKRSIRALKDCTGSKLEPGQTPDGLSFDLTDARAEILHHKELLLIRQDLIWARIVASAGAAGKTGQECYETIRPSTTVYSILSLMGMESWIDVPKPWKNLLTEFGRVLSDLRRCERLLACIAAGDTDKFVKEAESIGCDGWDPSIYPTWLLLEIESNITIRKRQVEMAMEMINPRTGRNAVLQLNMGEGKTSVITPMAAVVLADGNNLLRIHILKPLLRQSVNILAQRLGGLVNRRVYHVPFSRKTQLNSTVISNLNGIYEDCLQNRGILVSLPEHMLSLRLVCQDSADKSWFQQLIKLETMLRNQCRDLIDESDEVLDTKFQLVYTVGTQQTLDGSSNRWEVAQHLLQLVADQARCIRQEQPDSVDSACIEVSQYGRRYPILRFLKPDAFERLVLCLMDSIMHNGLPGMPFNQWTPALRNAALCFIRDLQICDTDQSIVRKTFESSTFFPKLLILRGFFAHGVLKFTLTGKRWLVDYGLHPARCLMAVPYRAKGVPSENAEFGHPDVAVILTCLSYYYEGLKRDQLRECFANLSKSNDPSTGFAAWVTESGLPSSLRSFSSVNLDDQEAFEKHLYPCLRYQKEVINFYLSHSVFPREGKEFPRKLSASAWDIPSQVDSDKMTTGLTTGFSGTNDNRFLLPHSIRQQDLPDLLHTNAMVLGHLLEPRNRICISAEDEKGHQLDVHQLLGLVCEKTDARVLIDVGAQILEASNRGVASEWLSMTPENEAEGAVFFNEADEILVIDREGHIESLLSSSFRERMGVCLVFLDQHHSRGVDLILPPETRAAVTLGPRLTKDRLVQACSRLRGLGKNQSVVFLMPPEVKHDMMTLFEDPSKSQFSSPDVLRWAMHQTCKSLDTLRPLWADHGLQHYRRTKIWKSITSQENPTEELVAQMQEPEACTLCELYAPWANQAFIPESHRLHDCGLRDPQVQELVQTLIARNSQAAGGGCLHEEQEREIAVEVEREVQVSRPTEYLPLNHHLDPKVRHLATHGKFLHGDKSMPFQPAYSILKRTSVRETSYPSSSLGADLYVTTDFANTVKSSHDNVLDEFLKSVIWILSNVYSNDLVILSQYEANAVIPVVLCSKHTSLHMYAPRSTKSMRSFRHLDFFTIGAVAKQPPSVIFRELELFAGSLYFSSYNEYRDFQSFLGLAADRLDKIPEGCMSTEGFVDMKTRQQLGWPVASPFRENPLPFLAALMHVRTKGQDYRHTHVGTIIDVKPLTEDRF